MSDRQLRLSIARDMLEMSAKLASDLRLAWARPLLEVEQRVDESGAVLGVDLSARPLADSLALLACRADALEIAVRALVVKRIETLRHHRLATGDPLKGASPDATAFATELVSAALHEAFTRTDDEPARDGGTDGPA